MTEPPFSRVMVFQAAALGAYVQRRFPSIARRFDAPFVALHAWNPGVVLLPEPSIDPRRDALPAGFADVEPVDVDRLVERATACFPAIQHGLELRAFCRRVADLRPRTVVEIGTASGGTFFCLCQLAAPDAVLVSIDLGEAGLGGQPDEDCRVFAAFARAGQRCHFVRGSSLDPASLRAVREILGDRRVDLLFIDGDHARAAVESDYETYAPLVRDGGLVAFHDITLGPEVYGPGFDVAPYWGRVKHAHRWEEIVDAEGARTPADVQARFAELVAADPLVGELLRAGLNPYEVYAAASGSELVQPSADQVRKAAGFGPGPLHARLQTAFGIGLLWR